MGQSNDYFRIVGGSVVASSTIDTPSMRIETLRRNVLGRMDWRFRQPHLALFWLERGARRLVGRIDGRPCDRTFSGNNRLAMLPPALEVEGEWVVDQVLDYTVVFLDLSSVEDRVGRSLSNSVIGFESDWLVRGLQELRREARLSDSVFELMAEGWATQALAYLYRYSDYQRPLRLFSGGLPGKARQNIEDYVQSNLAEAISLEELAGIAGLSKRHFLRAFRQSLGVSPYHYVVSRRIDEAKLLLDRPSVSITDIALQTGFGSAQHFSCSFKKMTGLTPSAFRTLRLS